MLCFYNSQIFVCLSDQNYLKLMHIDGISNKKNRYRNCKRFFFILIVYNYLRFFKKYHTTIIPESERAITVTMISHNWVRDLLF